jgi:hypothetical protein
MTPYYTPVPLPAAPSEAWPREYHTLTIPLSGYHGAELSVPKTMTRAEWQAMSDYLDILRGVIVDEGAPQ